MRFPVRLAANILNSISSQLDNHVADNKKEYNVILVDHGLSKVQVINEVRQLTGFGLAQAKRVVEKTPIILKKGLTMQEAIEIRNNFAKVGGTIILQEIKGNSSSIISLKNPDEKHAEYNVVLYNSGTDKVKVTKEIDLLIGIGLAQAKLVIDNIPIILKKNLSFKEAFEIKQAFAKIGATIVFQNPTDESYPITSVEQLIQEPNEFYVMLVQSGIEKLKVIKEIQLLTGVSLDEATNAVENMPIILKTGLSVEEAVAIKEKFRSIAATIEIRGRITK